MLEIRHNKFIRVVFKFPGFMGRHQKYMVKGYFPYSRGTDPLLPLGPYRIIRSFVPSLVCELSNQFS